MHHFHLGIGTANWDSGRFPIRLKRSTKFTFRDLNTCTRLSTAHLNREVQFALWSNFFAFFVFSLLPFVNHMIVLWVG